MLLLLIIKLRHKQPNQKEIEVRLKFTKALNLVKIPQSSNITSFTINVKRKHQPNYTSCKQITLVWPSSFLTEYCVYILVRPYRSLQCMYVCLSVYRCVCVFLKFILFQSLYSLFKLPLFTC